MGSNVERSGFRPMGVDELPQVIELFQNVFSAPSGHPALNAELLRWKYFQPRLDWAGPRSFVIEKAGRLVAHAGVWPVMLKDGTAGVHLIDWASDPQSPGAGVTLLHRITKTYAFVIGIGGSPQTMAIFPKFGFQHAGEALTWARPIRPLRQMFRHQAKNMGLVGRAARNLWWSVSPSRAVPGGFRAVPSSSVRDGAFFQYLTQCPMADFLSFTILRKGQSAGSFALSICGDQARVAGIWLEDPSDSANWRAAFLLAQEAALRHTGCSELIARAALEASAAGAAQAGMRIRKRFPAFLYSKHDWRGAFPLQFQLVDNDEVFLRGADAGFLT
jgi:hypothetical protein